MAADVRHHVHLKTEARMPVSQIVIVGLIIVVLGGGGLWYLNRKGEDNKLNSMFNSSETKSKAHFEKSVTLLNLVSAAVATPKHPAPNVACPDG